MPTIRSSDSQWHSEHQSANKGSVLQCERALRATLSKDVKALTAKTNRYSYFRSFAASLIGRLHCRTVRSLPDGPSLRPYSCVCPESGPHNCGHRTLRRTVLLENSLCNEECHHPVLCLLARSPCCFQLNRRHWDNEIESTWLGEK